MCLDRVLTNQLERFVLKEKNYFAGRAPDGLSVLVGLQCEMKLRMLAEQVTRKRVERLLPEDEDGFLRYIVYSVEKAIQAMKDGVDQWVWILDLKGTTQTRFIKSILWQATHLETLLGFP